MKRIPVLIACITLVALIGGSSTVSAHPGKTDEKGGHYDAETGEYHYHHGYPAHQHYDIDGDGKADCPYDFDDRTGWNSGSSSGGSSYSSNSYSDDYLDGYLSGHEDGYLDGYSDGEEEGYSNAETKWFLISVGVCAGTSAIAAFSTKKRKKEDAETISRLRSKLNEDSKQIIHLTSKQNELKEATVKIQQLEKSAASDFNATKSKIKEFHLSLVDSFGKDYLYILAGAPAGDYLDKKLLPHSAGSAVSPQSDKYQFYAGTISRNSVAKYHTYSCHYSRHSLPINAYLLMKSCIYTPCKHCNAELPDMAWVDNYLKYYNFLSKYIEIDISRQ